jgi:hypothetical protein
VRLEVVDVVGAVSRLVNKGYDREYRIKDGHLFDLALNSPLDPRDIHVDTALRLESGPNAGDASNIYAISDKKTHSKGLLIDAFDIFDEICDRGLAERLVESRYTEFVEDRDVPSRYGLRKVYKARFTRTSSTAIPSAMYCASDIRTFRNAPLVSRSRCSASIRLSRHMFGSSQAYSGIRD